MKRILIIIFLQLTIYCYLQSQENSANRFRFGVSFTPEINFTSENITESPYSFYELSPSKFNYNFGIIADYSFNRLLSISSGLKYSNKAYLTSYYCYTCDFGFDTRLMETNQRFLEIPANLQITFIRSKLDLYAIGGVSYSLLLQNINNTHNLVPDTKNYLINSSLGLGLEIPLSDKIDLDFASKYSQSISKFYNDSDFRFRSLSFETIILYKLIK